MRFGFVGLGRATMLYHLPAVHGLEGSSPCGGVDSDPASRERWQKETGTPAYASLAELLERERPDVVVVATPPHSHADLAVEALEGGAHVLSEKPFVPTVAEADRVLAAAARAGRQVAVNHQFREMPIFRAIRDGIESGEHGRLAFCQLWQVMNLAPWDEPTEWRASMSRGTLLEGGVHLVDLTLAFFGEHPVAVTASHSGGFHEDPQADAVQLVTIEFPGNRLGHVVIDRLCQGGTRYMEARADCEGGSLRASLGGRASIQVGKKRAEATGIRLDLGAGGLAWVERGLKRKTLARNPRDVSAHATAQLLAVVAPALERNEEPPSSGREARTTIGVIEAAYASAAQGERVELAAVLAPAGTV